MIIIIIWLRLVSLLLFQKYLKYPLAFFVQSLMSKNPLAQINSFLFFISSVLRCHSATVFIFACNRLQTLRGINLYFALCGLQFSFLFFVPKGKIASRNNTRKKCDWNCAIYNNNNNNNNINKNWEILRNKKRRFCRFDSIYSPVHVVFSPTCFGVGSLSYFLSCFLAFFWG